MKHIKTFENNLIATKEIEIECKSLFESVYGNPLHCYALKYYRTDSTIEIYFKLTYKIRSNYNLNLFIDFLKTMKDVNVDLIIDSGAYYISITDYELFIETLKTIEQANKYNL